MGAQSRWFRQTSARPGIRMELFLWAESSTRPQRGACSSPSAAGKLNAANVPALSLILQGLWAAILVLPRIYEPATQSWGNLYSNLLEYVISAALIFYVLTVVGVFRLRFKRPDAPRPYRTLGYP